MHYTRQLSCIVNDSLLFEFIFSALHAHINHYCLETGYLHYAARFLFIAYKYSSSPFAEL